MKGKPPLSAWRYSVVGGSVTQLGFFISNWNFDNWSRVDSGPTQTLGTARQEDEILLRYTTSRSLCRRPDIRQRCSNVKRSFSEKNSRSGEACGGLYPRNRNIRSTKTRTLGDCVWNGKDVASLEAGLRPIDEASESSRWKQRMPVSRKPLRRTERSGSDGELASRHATLWRENSPSPQRHQRTHHERECLHSLPTSRFS